MGLSSYPAEQRWQRHERGGCDKNETGFATATPKAKERPIAEMDELSIASDGGCCVLKRSSFSGRLRFDGAARIECEVSGEVYGTGTITVAEGARVMAPIRAASVLVAGHVFADVTARDRIEVACSGRVSGKLAAPVMVVRENGLVEGRITMTSNRPKDTP